jgi:hypothetical protein
MENQRRRSSLKEKTRTYEASKVYEAIIDANADAAFTNLGWWHRSR